MIEIWTDGRVFPTKDCSGLTVVLRHDTMEWRRGLIAGKITTNQVELKAIEYALKSIIDRLTDDHIIIYTLSRYAEMMFQKIEGKWAKNAEKNLEQIESLRKQFDRFSDIQIKFSPEHIRWKDIKHRTEIMVVDNDPFFEKG